MAGLVETLEAIKARPGVYLGRPSVSDLFMFLVGYEFSRSELGIDLTAQEQAFYDEFQPWLQQRLNMTSVASWAKLIMLSCHDEQVGFDRFFQLLDEFWQHHQRVESLEIDRTAKVASSVQ
ncbi:MAG: hypothetical protein SFY66_03935 [Oculatellaceae cyanobacterium bins.114]|nr:hypothetical protein [Oculatellaceae cyanobacterium bins.114]